MESAVAVQAPPSPPSVVAAPAKDIPPELSVPSAKQDTPAQKDEKTEATKPQKKKERRGSPVLAPLPMVSPAIGSGIIPIVGYIFPCSRNDKVSPPSTVGAAGLITDNGTRGFAVGGQLFLKQNTYEVTGGYARGNLDYNLYGIGTSAGDAGRKLPLDQTGYAYFAEALRRIVWQFFLGPRFFDGSSFITVRLSSGHTFPIPVPPDLGIHTTLRSFGLRLVRDTRPNHFYPEGGTKTEFTGDFFSEAWGSSHTFQRYKFNFDKYWSLSPKQVIAYDLYLCDTGGSPPFYANCIYGTSNELRGYTAGRYIDRHMYATQVEYRLSLPKRFGIAGFAGVGEVVPGGSEIFRSNNLLPSVGGGPRFVLSPKYHLNLRTDFARGKDSWTWSMGVGEAF